jgi:uncharacterized protein YqjF (DUF2071 family)
MASGSYIAIAGIPTNRQPESDVHQLAMPRPFLTADWKTLVMLNYEINPAVLGPYVPPGTELDAYQGRHFVSMVGFQFHRTRVKGLAIPCHVNFDEVNLRFYIRRKAPEGWRRAVAFIKEIVPRWAIATVARRVYNENYVALPMRSTVRLPTAEMPGEAVYRWKLDRQWHELGATFEGEPQLLQPESEEAFITEHYWGYVTQRDRSLVEYEVKHPSWRVWRAAKSWFHCDVEALYGAEFVGPLSREPASAFVAEGSAISVSPAGVVR